MAFPSPKWVIWKIKSMLVERKGTYKTMLIFPFMKYIILAPIAYRGEPSLTKICRDVYSLIMS